MYLCICEQRSVNGGSRYIIYFEQDVSINEQYPVKSGIGFLSICMVMSIERQQSMLKIGSWVRGRVKPITYRIDTCCFLVWCLTLIR